MKKLSVILLILGIAKFFGTAGASDCEVYNISQSVIASMQAILILIAAYITYFIGIAME